MTGDGLSVDAMVRRGGFSLTVAFEVPPGQVLGVLGPNGAGKTTLLRALAGLTPVAEGRVMLGGQVGLASHAAAWRRGLVPRR